MRSLIILRIHELKDKEQGFSKKVMRWKNFTNGISTKHISEVEFEQLRDELLLEIYERIIRQYYKQM